MMLETRCHHLQVLFGMRKLRRFICVAGKKRSLLFLPFLDQMNVSFWFDLPLSLSHLFLVIFGLRVV